MALQLPHAQMVFLIMLILIFDASVGFQVFVLVHGFLSFLNRILFRMHVSIVLCIFLTSCVKFRLQLVYCKILQLGRTVHQTRYNYFLCNLL